MTKRLCMFYTILFSFTTLFNSGLGYSAEQLSTDELRVLQQKMKNATQLSVDFTQQRSVSIRPNSPPAKSTGRAVFAKPAKVLWQLHKPPSIQLFDGETLYDLKESEGTATKYSATGERSQDIREIINLVLNFDNLLERYKLVESVKINNQINLTLEPKGRAGISEIKVEIDAASASIQGVSLLFPNKNKTSFQFSNPSRKAVPASTFEVPKRYKIINGV